MTEFKHSIVLFSGDDGLPLEFNVRNTNDKSHLKALIEHGGGICSQNENAVHLISPGTKVLNVDLGKKLVSTSYIYDCVKQNYLLDVNDYVFTITEAQTSDISDEDSERLLAQRQSTCKSPVKSIPVMNMEVSPIKQPNVSDETTPSNLTLPSSNSTAPPINNSSESFVECSQDASTSYRITSHVYYGKVGNLANEKIKTSEGLRENSEDFNPSQSIVSLPKQPDLLSDNMNLPSPSKTRHQLVYDSGNTFPPHSPSKGAKMPVHDAENLLQIRSPIKKTELPVSAARNPLPLLSPSKKAELPGGGVNCSLTLHSPSKPDHKTSPQKAKKIIFPSPIKLVDISPIMRVDAKKNHRNCANHCLELPIRNPFQVSPEDEPLEKELQGNFEKETDNMDVDNIAEPEIHLSPPTVKNPVNGFENANCPSKKNVMNTSAIVSSSQPEDELDKFDSMLLSKALHKPHSEDEGSVSQTCTVSSSADAQVSSKPCSAESNTPPLQEANPDNLPDSPNLTEINEEEYIRNLEVEVQGILEKTSPRTIQDKITLVKYVCCVRKLTPRIVLESLSARSNSLEL